MSLQWETPSQVRLKLIHSPLAHSNSSCARQEEFTAVEGEGVVSGGPASVQPCSLGWSLKEGSLVLTPCPPQQPLSQLQLASSPRQVKSSWRIRPPRQEQLTWPWWVSRHRSWQPPLLIRQGESSPEQGWREGDGKLKRVPWPVCSQDAYLTFQCSARPRQPWGFTTVGGPRMGWHGMLRQ